MEPVKRADHYNRNLECPSCGKKSRFKIWDRIQIDKNPGLREKSTGFVSLSLSMS